MSSRLEPYDALPDGLLVADSDGTVELSNVVACEMLGLADDRGIGRPLREVLALQDRDGITWWGTNEPYDGLPTRVRLTEQSWILPGGEIGRAHV